MTETLTWRGDGLLTDYTATRSDFTDTRHYAYQDWSQRCFRKPVSRQSQPLTNNYDYDQGTAGGLGVLTAASQSSAELPGQWGLPSSGGMDGLSRVVQATNTVVKRTAHGQVNGAASLRADLNNRPLAIRHDSTQAGQWLADMELVAGTNTLEIIAEHPEPPVQHEHQQFVYAHQCRSRSGECTYDGNGNVTQRVWKNHTNGTVRTQTLTWDAFNRLAAVTERDAEDQRLQLASRLRWPGPPRANARDAGQQQHRNGYRDAQPLLRSERGVPGNRRFGERRDNLETLRS